jgi:hypothetical protein
MPRRSLRRLILTGFMLLTFLFQSYAIQTHIHPLQGIPGITALKLAPAATTKPHKNIPLNTADPDCALCQLLYGGQHVAPDALVFFLPMVAVSTIEIALGVTPHYDAVSHSWRGRAPPQS